MRRPLALFLFALPLLGATTPIPPSSDQILAIARADVARAAAEEQRLTAEADRRVQTPGDESHGPDS